MLESCTDAYILEWVILCQPSEAYICDSSGTRNDRISSAFIALETAMMHTVRIWISYTRKSAFGSFASDLLH